MPAMLDDPTGPVMFRQSGDAPYPTPYAPLPPEIVPRQVTLRDRVTTATLVPFSSPDQVPLSLLEYLSAQWNKEIEEGDTYPMIDPVPLESFAPYWFANFGAVMLLGDIHSAEEVRQMGHNGCDWEKRCLGAFYIKPNYPGRSSHVCNGGFLVTNAARNRGVGRLMGEGYLEWAPKLGYTYSIFNLVYETNVVSCRIWDALGFKRIGRIKGCGNLRSYPDQLIDAIMYGRELGPEAEDYVSEERFDKIKYYLKHGKYPNGADRAQKSRLRSAATHYKLIPATDDEPEKLMLKGKEVISDPQRQYEVARQVHMEHHGGINKTTANIAERYHWVRIKETVSMVIRNCPDCKDTTKPPPAPLRHSNTDQSSAPPAVPTLPSQPSSSSQALSPELQSQSQSQASQHSTQQPNLHVHADPQNHGPLPIANVQHIVNYQVPVDPRIMDGIESPYQDFSHASALDASYAHHAQSFHAMANSPQDIVSRVGLQGTAPSAVAVARQAMGVGLHEQDQRELELRQQLMNEGYGTQHGHV